MVRVPCRPEFRRHGSRSREEMEGEADVFLPRYDGRGHPSRRGVVSVLAVTCVDNKATVE
jgi:hypothetical protein